MGIVQRQGLINSIVSYLGILIGFFNIAYLFPKFFSPEHMGLRSVLFEFSLFLAQISTLGFTGLANKYFPYFHTNERQEKGFLTFILSVPAVGFALLVFIILLFRDNLFLSFQERSPLLSEYYPLIFIIGFFILQSLILEIFAAFFNPIAGNFFRDVFQRLLTTLLIFLYVLKIIDVHQFWLLFTASFAMSFAGLVIYLWWIKAFRFNFDFSFLDRKTLGEMASFGLFGMLNSAASMLVLKIDVILIVYILKDLSLTGIYSLAIYVASVIEIPKKALVQITNPLLSKAYKENDIATVEDIYKKTAINQFIAGTFIFLGIWTNIDEIFQLLPKGDIYAAGKYSILFLGLAKIIDMGTGVNGEIISYSKLYRYNLLFVITLAGLGIIFNLFLIPDLGITGSALATTASYFIYNLVKFIFVQKRMKIQPFSRNYWFAVLLACFAYLVLYFVKIEGISLYITIAAKGLLLSALFIVPVLFFRLSPDLNQLAGKILKRKI